MSGKEHLKAKQRAYIAEVIAVYKTNLTSIARAIDKHSTTLTRWYNGNPKDALSAVTWESIKEKYPLPPDGEIKTEKPEKKEKNTLNEAESALAYAVTLIFRRLIRMKILSADDIDSALSEGAYFYRLHPVAAGLLEDLRASATAPPSQTQQKEPHTLQWPFPHDSS